MKKDLAGIEMDEERFAAVARLCKNDLKFPSSFAEWNVMEQTGRLEASAAGRPVVRLVVEPEAFQTWCEVVGIVPCLEALRAFAIVKRAEAAGLKRAA
ncbi:hypothetical protein OOT46_02440 [Aquabacterium sp. A7-Y]|uniref:hypothetical protein n=1 Tax=Aquabacterium sp. A7-Y TaxID=1349605 RepID=UPI00223C99C4|nr:hypothetical protein [Aquabacterium sp. A7-Y]MCW7536712.1 hypothetical protein [Aquabacterium sp. A7-Y]